MPLSSTESEDCYYVGAPGLPRDCKYTVDYIMVLPFLWPKRTDLMIQFSLNFVSWRSTTIKNTAIEMPGTSGQCKHKSLVVLLNMGAEFDRIFLVAHKVFVKIRG
jgi:hypothetical protein